MIRATGLVMVLACLAGCGSGTIEVGTYESPSYFYPYSPYYYEGFYEPYYFPYYYHFYHDETWHYGWRGGGYRHWD